MSGGVEYFGLVSCTESSKKNNINAPHEEVIFLTSSKASQLQTKDTSAFSFELSCPHSGFLDIFTLYLSFTSIND
jgi:hypothetical protein